MDNVLSVSCGYNILGAIVFLSTDLYTILGLILCVFLCVVCIALLQFVFGCCHPDWMIKDSKFISSLHKLNCNYIIVSLQNHSLHNF